MAEQGESSVRQDGLKVKQSGFEEAIGAVLAGKVGQGAIYPRVT
jgi:hypothetical protein